ncbi:MAG: hypothetical protein JST12_05620 [Armatimonadetes bacterium]|nr:hypothetical protein [Armatimonadota bacterium]
MANRKKTPTPTETSVLTKSARRCPVCFHLFGDLEVKHGQIAHLDKNPANFSEDNLAFMCLDHHSDFDSTTSQHKNFTRPEIVELRRRLYEAIAQKQHHSVKIETSAPPTDQLDDVTRLVDRANSQDVAISVLLREAKVLAKKRGDTEILDWLEKELTGYQGVESKDLPSYRQTRAEVYAFNPYHGWRPVLFADEETRMAYTYAPVGQSIGSIEESLNNQTTGHFIFHSPELIQHIEQNLDLPAKVQIRSSTTVLYNIVEAVRNQLHEWASNLT